jgi:hypothetical protein
MSQSHPLFSRFAIIVVLMAVAGCNLEDTATPPTRDAAVSDGPSDTITFDAVEDTSTSDLSDTDLSDTNVADTAPDGDSGGDSQACPDDQSLCASGCSNTSSDPQNCGSCDRPCNPPTNAQVLACQSGDCAFECQQGYFDLNDDLSNPDGDGCEADCKPSNGGVELCIDGLDNDCNGQEDDGCECNAGETFECGTDVGQCELGTITCQSNGEPGACQNQVESGVETCNNLDDDCDGSTDENLTQTCGSNTGVCSEGTSTCSSGSWGSCQGSTGSSTEVCDDKDNDCDGQVDNGFDNKGKSCTVGTGACQRSGTFICGTSGSRVTCDATPGSPAAEVCDNIDNDCNGSVDDSVTRSCGTDVGTCSTGTETCSSGSWGSCQGSTGSSTEVCDGQDNDCDGGTDENVKPTYYFDSDNDGYGTSAGLTRCNPLADYNATQTGDCDDDDDSIHPGANQYCSGNVDNDCDGDAACADSECNGQACLSPESNSTCQKGTCTGGSGGGCMVLCKLDEYCTCEGTQCCPDGQLCLCQ